MREGTCVLKLDKYQEGAVLTALNDLRNKLLSESKVTDTVDEILLKIISAPYKKARGRDEAR